MKDAPTHTCLTTADTIDAALTRIHDQGDYTRAEIRDHRALICELSLMGESWVREYPLAAELARVIEGAHQHSRSIVVAALRKG